MRTYTSCSSASMLIARLLMNPPGRRTRLAALTIIAGLATAFTATTALMTTSPAAKRFIALSQTGPCSSPANAIVAENCQQGNPASEWDITGIGDPSIQGFATDISVNRGETVRFKVKTNASAYRLDIYRLGYYGGNGARKVTTIQPSASLPQTQPNCLTDTATGLIDCGNWAESASWNVPATAVSGIYLARLVRTGTNGASHIVFIVRHDGGASDLLFQTADTTWQAYNNYGGNSLYTGSPAGRAYKVSYNRPFNTRTNEGGANWLFNAEHAMVRWLESNGYDVSYFTGLDSDRRGAEISNHQVFLSVGHDEYWSGAQRTNVEAARAAGVHLAFFSGNEIFWKTRWEPSIDGSSAPHKTLVCYKETHAGARLDPGQPWTGTWRDPRFSPPADGGRPENALSGTIFTVNGERNDALAVSETEGKLRFWRNTGLATLNPGQTATLPAGTLGYEWDEELDNGSRPAGLIHLSTQTVTGVPLLQDYGSTYATGTATHHLTLYRHSSGALVFGAGTVQWSWGLDATHDRSNLSGGVDQAMKQATVNLLADMGAQPGSLQGSLVAATGTTDNTSPTSTITSPAPNSTLQSGSAVTISGTASDVGGVVGGVEISVDNGATWHPTSGRQSWSFSWTPSTGGQVTIKSRAVDDSGNMENPSAGVTVTVSTQACPCSIWSSSTVPSRQDSDTSAVEIGVKFRSDTSGYITALRFYKYSANTGTHIGNLWTRTGTRLATATFTSETASGWQQVSFASPVPITANTTYVASYHTSVGRYAVNSSYFAAAGVDNGPLHALRDGTDGGNGVYSYNSSSVFPNQTYQSENYWVDVVFTTTTGPDTTPPTVISTSPVNGATGISTGASITAAFSEAMNGSTINANTFELRDSANMLVSAAVTYDAATKTATLDPTSTLIGTTTYTATIKGGATDPRVKDVAGNALANNFTWSFTTIAADTTAPTVTTVMPLAGATGVSTATNVTATFSEAMDPATINSTTFELRDSANALVPASVSYDSGTRTVTLDPTPTLNTSTTYTATIKGGATDPRVKDLAGNALASNNTWSFTTAAAPPPPACPCSIWSSTTLPSRQDSDTSAVEIGVKFRSDVSGYITALRFYKYSSNTGTHIGNLWSSNGTRLATATFTGETASGWQQVSFASPVAITANTTYVASYHTSAGRYAVDSNYFAAAGRDNAPLHALRDGVEGGNGVYRYSTSSVFPNLTYQSENYWVDVVFTTTIGPDTTAPTVNSVTPSNGATDLRLDTNITTVFNEPMDPATINASSFELRDSANALVPVVVTSGGETPTVTLDPVNSLVNSMTYTVTVRGGATDPRVKDLAGNALAANYTSSFTTAAAPAPPPNDGPGGPILVISWSSNPFSRYYGEILRAEGLNEFLVMDISSVSSTTLASYDVVILGDMPLSAAQVTMFGNWVNSGGNLIAMRPDKQLAGLLGLADQSLTRSNAYLQVNTASGPGVGITNQSIQFHGTADLYNLTSATSVAALYSNATTATPNPAVTLTSVGANGGQAAAFTFDLARSIIYTRQGNPLWSGQERDGVVPIRSDDLFFGAASGDVQPNWVDLNKVAIPQADEQQRLLANLILDMNRDRKPLPRFWYFPRGGKAVVIMTGDDHAQGGTAGRFDQFIAASPANCSVADWECIRGTSYVFANSPLTNAQAATYNANGFEVGLHVNTNCANWATTSELQFFYTTQLNSWRSKYTSLPSPTTNRTHCIVWSDYATQPKIELSNGIRLDTNYYYYPGGWVQNRPGFFTGSGMPMRFADVDGTMIDVYQAATQMTDESNQTYPFTVDALLDKALGPEGYYGVFTANIHTDNNSEIIKNQSDAIINSAIARGVPVVSSRQMLTWLDGRNGSSFGALTWSDNTLSFSITTAAGANGLQAMLPVTTAAGTLTGITLNGSLVGFTVRTIKGVDYAFFSTGAGAYQATYAP